MSQIIISTESAQNQGNSVYLSNWYEVLTCGGILPDILHEGVPVLDSIFGDGAVVVCSTAPLQRYTLVGFVYQSHPTRGAGRTWGEERNKRGVKGVVWWLQRCGLWILLSDLSLRRTVAFSVLQTHVVILVKSPEPFNNFFSLFLHFPLIHMKHSTSKPFHFLSAASF